MSNINGKESWKCSRLDVISKKAHFVYMKKPKVNRLRFAEYWMKPKVKGTFLPSAACRYLKGRTTPKMTFEKRVSALVRRYFSPDDWPLIFCNIHSFPNIKSTSPLHNLCFLQVGKISNWPNILKRDECA